MQNTSTTCPELDTEYREEGSGVIECIDTMFYKIRDLTDRMDQIMAISFIARESLMKPFSCAENVLDDVFRAIEYIASNK